DSVGRAQEGLRQDNFMVFVENSPQVASNFSAQEEPASVVFLMDLSGSMSTPNHKISRVTLLTEPITRFLQLSNPANEYSIVRFSNTSSVTLNWTRDRAEVVKMSAALGEEKAGGQTGLYDACQFAIKHAQT